MRHICVFGASITSGLNDFKNAGWCEKLKKSLLKKDVFVYNLGISGDDSSDLLKRIKPECDARKPDLIILALGGNDSQFILNENRFRTPLDVLKNNFENLIKISKSFTKNIIIVGLTKVDEEKINKKFIENKNKMYKNEYLEKYDLTIKEIALKNQIKFIPLFDLIDKEDLDDGLHPTSLGHNKIFNRVRKNIKI